MEFTFKYVGLEKDQYAVYHLKYNLKSDFFKKRSYEKFVAMFLGYNHVCKEKLTEIDIKGSHKSMLHSPLCKYIAAKPFSFVKSINKGHIKN